MMENHADLTRRLRRLERDNRVLKCLAGIVLSVAAVVVIGGANFNAAANEVFALDAAGRVRTRMAVDANNHAYFQHFDGNGRLRAFLGESDDGIENLTMYNADGNRAMYLGFTDQGEANFSVYDDHGTRRIFLGFSGTGKGNITFYDENGNSVQRLGE